MEVSEAKEDVQELMFCTYPSESRVFEVIAFWDVNAHADMTLHIKGNTAVDVVMGIKIKGSQEVMVVRKTINLKMYGPKEKFTLMKK
ncbi:hypothetical protein BSKO_01257 [Bryopsis sp. KO-2023]|nr:hypothetical protein BSKO_01257 [Bryopsis sp. KO-2023]